MTLPEATRLILDQVRQRLIALNEPLTFGVASTPTDLEAVFRLRYATVMEHGWAKPEDYPDGLEKDSYDDHALQIACWDATHQLVATTRIVLPVSGQPLPTEAAFDLPILPVGGVVDVGRTAVTPEYRHRDQHLIVMGLHSQVWHETTARQYEKICAAMTGSMVRLYRFMGFHFNTIGAAQDYWGEKRYPCEFDPIKTAEALHKNFNL